MEFEGLKKVIMVGVETAAKSLAVYLGQGVDVGTSDIEVLPVEQIAKTLGNKEDLVTAVLLQITGSIEGELMFIFTAEGAENALNLISAKHKVPADRSALQEVGNIVSGNGFTAIDAYFGLQTEYSAPGVAHDMLGAVTDPVIAALGAQGEDVFLITTDFLTRGKPLFKTVFLANSSSTRKLVQELEQTKDHESTH